MGATGSSILEVGTGAIRPVGPWPRGESWTIMRHLAFACGVLARGSGLSPSGRERYRDAEATFRSLADSERGFLTPEAGPSWPSPPAVETGVGAGVSLSDLLAHVWQRHGKPFPGRAIDPEMVEAAQQLLEELSWHFPVPCR